MEILELLHVHIIRLFCLMDWQLERVTNSFLFQKELHDRYIYFSPYT